MQLKVLAQIGVQAIENLNYVGHGLIERQNEVTPGVQCLYALLTRLYSLFDFLQFKAMWMAHSYDTRI